MFARLQYLMMIKRLYDEKKIPLEMLERLLKDYQNKQNLNLLLVAFLLFNKVH
jgi:hypothetical protein